MSKRTPTLLIQDMYQCLEKIERYTAGLDRQAFLSDDKTIDAVVRNLEIIGEAVRRLPDDFKSKHKKIPWYRIAGLRNRIVHDYFGLDLEIVWHIISSDLQDLKTSLEELGN